MAYNIYNYGMISRAIPVFKKDFFFFLSLICMGEEKNNFPSQMES